VVVQEVVVVIVSSSWEADTIPSMIDIGVVVDPRTRSKADISGMGRTFRVGFVRVVVVVVTPLVGSDADVGGGVEGIAILIVRVNVLLVV